MAWRFIGFYGSPTVAGKSVAWDLLRVLRGHHNLPWICGGDFNELLQGEEKWGRVARPESQMKEFRKVIDECEFVDLGFVGSPFTWWNKQNGIARVVECLDRCLATAEWLLKFPNNRVTHLRAVFSDHRPLWVELSLSGNAMWPHRKCFRFEEMWTFHQGCEDTIRKAWETRHNGTLMFQVVEKIKASREELKKWSFNQFGSIWAAIATKTRMLQQEEELRPEQQNVSLIQKLGGELADLHSKEEKMWRQRSRVLWLQNGDRNTKYFHCQATYRKRRNYIHGIRDQFGIWQNRDDDVEHTIVEYYKNLFTTSQPGEFDEILLGVDRVVTADMNLQLDAEFTAAEVEHALNQMSSLKAPGFDGMPLFFIRNIGT